jgi:hypothetical protein
MSDDDFEESAGSSSANTEEYKYAQLHVPNFEFDVSSSDAAAAANNASGNSFVRLGSFPSFTLETTTVTEDGASKTMRIVKTVAGDAPYGFSNSLNLAKLIGDADEISSAETGGDTAADASGIQRSSQFEGDSNYLLGFADDTRSRLDDVESDTSKQTEKILIDGTSVTDSQANRKKETKRLLTKGGWWDHSDGNRVTTTSGDKIEVIQGNYKMVILGRQDPSQPVSDIVGNAFITDISGGHLQEQGPSPTACIKSVEWVKSEDGWTLYQDNGSGNVTTTFHGKQVDYYTGARKESYVGKQPASIEHRMVDKGEGLLIAVDQLPNDDDDPVLISKTWAKRIETYNGADGKPVPVIYAFTHAESIDNVVIATQVANCNVVGVSATLNTGLVLEANLSVKGSFSLVEDRTAVLSKLLADEHTEVTGERVEASFATEYLFISKSAIAAEDTELVDVRTGVVTENTLLSTINTKVTMEVDTVITEAVVMLSGETTIT